MLTQYELDQQEAMAAAKSHHKTLQVSSCLSDLMLKQLADHMLSRSSTYLSSSSINQRHMQIVSDQEGC